MTERHQLHLYVKGGKGFSGRGVRLREVTPDMLDEAKVTAAKASADDQATFVSALEREIMYRAISEMTGPDVTPEKLPEAKWISVTALELQTPGGPKYLGALFKTKDIQILRQYIERNYFASNVEAEMIMGGGVAVSGD